MSSSPLALLPCLAPHSIFASHFPASSVCHFIHSSKKAKGRGRGWSNEVFARRAMPWKSFVVCNPVSALMFQGDRIAFWEEGGRGARWRILYGPFGAAGYCSLDLGRCYGLRPATAFSRSRSLPDKQPPAKLRHMEGAWNTHSPGGRGEASERASELLLLLLACLLAAEPAPCARRRFRVRHLQLRGENVQHAGLKTGGRVEEKSGSRPWGKKPTNYYTLCQVEGAKLAQETRFGERERERNANGYNWWPGIPVSLLLKWSQMA